MKYSKFFGAIFVTFLLQFYLSEFLSINMVRPDFMVIFILFTSIRYGRLYGVIAGFILGLFTDLAGVGSYFGLSPLIYSVSGYLAGYLQNKYNRLLPLYFHLSWIGIIILHFLIFSFVRYQYIYETNKILFLSKWIITMAYTFGFILILQLIFPFRRIHRAEGD